MYMNVVKSTKHRRRNKGDNDEGRRSVHNSLERQRRVDLRNAFETLRQLVPDTKIQEKAPKVQILKKAALHCKNLQQAELRLLREKEKLKRQLQELEQRKALCCGTSS
ncbi:N-myc proto-oncogene protein-like [Scylla paramamosain]|uniref:N-myc proto-oncogene protein-like n=1 Tax=Scylla paramamosain TaxID=85552 RepID=UPI003083040E